MFTRHCNGQLTGTSLTGHQHCWPTGYFGQLFFTITKLWVEWYVFRPRPGSLNDTLHRKLGIAHQILESDPWWTGIPSWRGRNTLSCFILQKPDILIKSTPTRAIRSLNAEFSCLTKLLQFVSSEFRSRESCANWNVRCKWGWRSRFIWMDDYVESGINLTCKVNQCQFFMIS